MNELVKKIVETIADQIVNRVLERVEQSSQSINVNNVGTKLYTTKQLCEMLHISKAKLYRHREQGYLRPTIHVFLEIAKLKLYSVKARVGCTC